MRILTLVDILEYYDVPQIFNAADAMGTCYLCTLYDHGDKGLEYIGVQMSEERMKAFLKGELDLRKAYLCPEAEGALYNVYVKDETITTGEMLNQNELSETMLPAEGYFFDSSEFQSEETGATSTYQLEVPASDKPTFSTLMSRMGWKVSEIGKDLRRVAAL